MVPRGGVDGVLFDIDDTLVDTRAAFAAALAAVSAVYLPHVGPDRHADVLATWRADVGGHYRAYTRGEVSHRVQRKARIAALHAAFDGPDIDDDEYEAWDAAFGEAFEGAWRAFDDAHDAVRRVTGAGLVVGALSNASVEHQVRKLARVGLASVPMLVGVDTIGVGKPDPRVFALACERLGTDPARTVYVGDELDIDAFGAADAGLQGVWLDRPGARRGGAHLEDPERAREASIPVLPSLTALAELLGS